MMVASPKREMELLEGQKHFSLLEGEALLKRDANPSSVATLSC